MNKLKIENYSDVKDRIDRQSREDSKLIEFQREVEQIRKEISDTPSRIDAILKAYEKTKKGETKSPTTTPQPVSQPTYQPQITTTTTPSATERSLNNATLEEEFARIRQEPDLSKRIDERMQLFNRWKEERAKIPQKTLQQSQAQMNTAMASRGLTTPQPTVSPSLQATARLVHGAANQPAIIAPPPIMKTQTPIQNTPQPTTPTQPVTAPTQNIAQSTAPTQPTTPPPPVTPEAQYSETVAGLKEQGAIPYNAMYISGIFGEKREGGRLHAGVDIAAVEGTLMPSPARGYVKITQEPGYGRAIVIVDPERPDTQWVLGHVGNPLVKEGDYVEVGQPIATPGTSGNVKGSNPYHLHYEVRKNGTPVDPIIENPTIFAPMLPHLFTILSPQLKEVYQNALSQTTS